MIAPFQKRKTLEVKIGKVKIGNGNPIAIQSMTNTPTDDVEATVKQIIELVEAGSEIVRFTVKDDEMAKAVPEIKKQLLSLGYGEIPLVGDFHYNGHLLLRKYPKLGEILDKLRVNPGNVGFGNLRDKNFEEFVKIAIEYDKPIRIGGNWGSLDQQILTKLIEKNKKLKEPKPLDIVTCDALIESVLISAKKAQELGLAENKIVLSAKVSEVNHLIYVYKKLAEKSKFPLHLGLTEAGTKEKGIVASAIGIGYLLYQGIGDTIRVSYTSLSGENRTKEVEICKLILQVLGLRYFEPIIISCPGCGRTLGNEFMKAAEEISNFLKEKIPEWKVKDYKGWENMKVAVMGCIVNGLGESKQANIGLSFPGRGENPRPIVFADGKQIAILEFDKYLREYKKLIEKYVEEHYGTSKQN